jgi:hypothetical protein
MKLDVKTIKALMKEEIELQEIAPAIAGIARAAAAGAGYAVGDKLMSNKKKVKKEQDGDPVQKAQDKLDKVKKIADLKKQMTAVQNEDVEDINEFTTAQIDRLKKEYEPLRGKETGLNPEKFAKLRKMMRRMTKDMLLKLVKADIPLLTTGAKASLVINHGMKWSQLPEELIPYMEELEEATFKSVDKKVMDRIAKMLKGPKDQKLSIQNMLNYFMPPEVVDMVRDKFRIKEPRGKIKIR